jgi:hypothetical protein
VLLFEYPRCQCLRSVIVLNLNGALKNDWTGVQIFINKMHRASGNLYTVINRLLLDIQPRERWQETRMDVHNAIRERLNKIFRKQPHVTRETYQLDIAFPQLINDLRVVLFTGAPSPLDDYGLDTTRARLFESAAFGLSLITTAIEELGISPLFTASTSATMFDPRPEMRMPIFIKRNRGCGMTARHG